MGTTQKNELHFYLYSSKDNRELYVRSENSPACTCPYCNLTLPLKSICLCGGQAVCKDIIHFLARCSECFEVFTVVCRCDKINADFVDNSGTAYALASGLKAFTTFPKRSDDKKFPQEIEILSPKFIEVYKEAMAAKTDGLNTLVGMGLRKATEFLVIDYIERIMKIRPEVSFVKAIKQLDVKDADVIADLIRIVGNNETHTTDKINDPDLGIDFMLDCIESFILLIQLELKKPKHAELRNELSEKLKRK